MMPSTDHAAVWWDLADRDAHSFAATGMVRRLRGKTTTWRVWDTATWATIAEGLAPTRDAARDAVIATMLAYPPNHCPRCGRCVNASPHVADAETDVLIAGAVGAQAIKGVDGKVYHLDCFLPSLRLEIAMIPSPLFGQSLRRLAKRATWDRLRFAEYARSDNRCVVCGTKASLDADEVWSYDETNCIATLIDVRGVCRPCHAVKHPGATIADARRAGKDTKRVDDELAEHFCAVNGVDRNVWETHRRIAQAIWNRRSRLLWSIEWGRFQAFLPTSRFERLRAAVGRIDRAPS